jgi:5'-phosphate synthase pdxT subunit
MVSISRPTVGILGYQGCIEPHEAMYASLGVPCIRVRTPEELAAVDRLILPGGESTTMLKFLSLHSMIDPIRSFAKTHPVWGICAGAILIASEVTNPSQSCLSLIDIAAHRNFYGSQLDSFTTPLAIDFLPHPVEAHFIRAPLLSLRTTGVARTGEVQVHAYHDTQPVFFTQGHIWACSFHVELGSDTALHQHFAELA